jgi:N-acetylglucosaminyldiphosphoundecaprenol N-acetyl-beta-D-mannosaminyltransferase
MKKINLLKVDIAQITKHDLEIEIERYLLDSGQTKIAKLNSEFLLRGIKSKEFRDTLNSFDLNISDGIGVLWAAKYLSMPQVSIPVIRQLQAVWQMIYTGVSLVFYPKYCRNPLPESIPGVQALLLMLKAAEGTNSPVYFMGSDENTFIKAREEIKKLYPNIIIAGSNHDIYAEDLKGDYSKVISDINKNNTKLLIVGLGSPKQEYFIRNNIKNMITVRVVVGEGGTVDRLAKTNQIAPEFINKIGLEWFWRTFMNANKTGSGHRIKRVWNAVPVFIYEVVKWKLRYGSNK